MMNRVLASASFVPRTCVRRLSTTINRGKAADLSAIKEKQKQFQTNIDVPIYLRGGGMDKVLFGITIGLTGLSLAFAAKNIYVWSTKK